MRLEKLGYDRYAEHRRDRALTAGRIADPEGSIPQTTKAHAPAILNHSANRQEAI